MSPESKAADDLFLVFDAGTQSIRSGLVDLAGNVLDHVKIPVEPYFSERRGWAELHPGRILEQILRGQRPADKEERWPERQDKGSRNQLAEGYLHQPG